MRKKTPQKIFSFISLIFFLLLFISSLSIDQNNIKSDNHPAPIELSATLDNYTMEAGHYSWTNPAGGTDLSLGDKAQVSRDLPFQFTFYDQTYSSVYVTSEGYLTFISITPVQQGGTIPSSSNKAGYLIGPYWTDFDGTGTISVKNTSTEWVVSYINMVHEEPGGATGDFQVILYDTGVILFNFQALTNVYSEHFDCGLNKGDAVYFNNYTGLPNPTNSFGIKFTPSTGDGGGGGGGLPPNGDEDGAAAALLAGLVTMFIIIGAVVGVLGFYYHKDPEKFRANMKKAREKLIEKGGVFKEKMKSGGGKLKTKLISGGGAIKEKAGNAKNKFKEKINKETLKDFGKKLKDRKKDKLIATKGKPKDSSKKLSDKNAEIPENQEPAEPEQSEPAEILETLTMKNTVKEMKDFAEKNNIDIKGITKKTEILEAIKKA